MICTTDFVKLSKINQFDKDGWIKRNLYWHKPTIYEFFAQFKLTFKLPKLSNVSFLSISVSRLSRRLLHLSHFSRQKFLWRHGVFWWRHHRGRFHESSVTDLNKFIKPSTFSAKQFSSTGFHNLKCMDPFGRLNLNTNWNGKNILKAITTCDVFLMSAKHWWTYEEHKSLADPRGCK